MSKQTTVRRALQRAMGPAAGAALLAWAPAAAAADRVYELVSPSGADAQVRIASGPATPDGEVVCFNVEDRLAGSEPNGIVFTDDGHCARRTASGWATEWLTGGAPPEGLRYYGSRISAISDDGQRALFVSDHEFFPDAFATPTTPTWNTFAREHGQLRWLTPNPAPPQREWNPSGRRTLAVTRDLSRGVFATTVNLLPADQTPDAGGANASDVYLWTPGGLELVSRDPSGAAVGWSAVAGLSRLHGRAVPNALAPGGGHVFFMYRPPVGTTPALPAALSNVETVYRNRGGTVVLASPRDRGPTLANRDIYLVGASADGDVVYLQSTAQLTMEPKLGSVALIPAIYRYTISEDKLELVATNAAGAFGLWVSDDGSTVLYRRGAGASARLIVNRDGTETDLGGLQSTEFGLASRTSVASPAVDHRQVRMSPDGRTILFASSGQILPDSVPGISQVYLWREGEGVTRISTSAHSPTPSGRATIGSFTDVPVGPSGGGRQEQDATFGYANRGRVHTSGWETIFFDTTQALVPEDVNGRNDVYEWRDGDVRLVTPGTGDSDAYYVDSSADGSSVFFTTYQRILPREDRNGSNDLYVARAGGGFPPPPEPSVGAAPGAAGPAAPHAAPAPPTAMDRAPEPPVPPGPLAPPPDVDAPPAAPATVAFVSRRLSTSGRRVVAAVEASAPGRLRVTLLRPSGKRLATASRQVRHGGEVRVRLRLPRAAARRLARTGRMPVGAVVVLRPETGQAARLERTVTLRSTEGARR